MTHWRSAVAAMLLLNSCSNPSSTGPTSSPSPNATPTFAAQTPVARQVLSPARTLPVVALCSQPLATDQNGNAAPVLCTDGALNVLAWKVYAPISPRVLSAGPAASLDSVRTALRRDVNVGHASTTQERSAYELAAAYYGWNFSTDPTASP